ncbi:NADPH oxidase 4-like [Mya arenaria]|uniref:NADPH oxidase 4-like n=1 Tax=Mya arenaria TaxID=6604 RepID=UPI0022E79B8C|nr:NADPH oxidase 4-like [Mya arenaria]
MSCRIYGWILNNGTKTLFKAVWCSLCGILFWRAFVDYKYSPEYIYLHQILGIWLCIARASAAVLHMNLAAVLIPLCRGLALWGNRMLIKFGLGLTWLRWSATSFHVFIGNIIMIFTVIHVVAHSFNTINFSINTDDNVAGLHPFPNQTQAYEVCLSILIFTVPGATGLLMTIILCVLFWTSLQTVRRRFFNMFWYSHRLAVVLLLPLLLVHGHRGPLRRQINTDRHFPGCNLTLAPFEDSLLPVNGSNQPEQHCLDAAKFDHIPCSSWQWLILPLILYCCDVVYRMIRRSHKVTDFSVTFVSDNVLELAVKSTFIKAKPGQYVLLNCPVISSLEWHPFTVSEVPCTANEHILKLMIGRAGDWTDELFNRLSSRQQCTESTTTTRHNGDEMFRIDGPFTSPLEHIDGYKDAVIVTGGVGVAPVLAWCRRFKHAEKSHRICIIFVTRDDLLLKFVELICEQHRSKVVNIQTKAELYYTGQRKLSQHETFSKGRPNIRAILHNLNHKKGSKVGVFVCGPPPMCKEAKRICLDLSSRNVQYVCHKETI